MAGWVFRKGEIVWVWIGDDEEELDLTLNEDWASWAAGAVVQKPAVNTALKTAVSGGGAFSSMGIDGPAPWEEGQDDW